MSIEIREATQAEVPDVLSFLDIAAAVPGIPDNVERLASVVAACHAWLLVAMDGNQIVGTVIAGWDGWRGSIYRLAVAPERRREGIARALVGESEARLFGEGAPRVAALVFRAEQQANAFWRGIGYEEDTRGVRFVRNR